MSRYEIARETVAHYLLVFLTVYSAGQCLHVAAQRFGWGA